ncbi:SH3 domain-containing protein [Thermodesulfobacteriota bacterium]
MKLLINVIIAIFLWSPQGASALCVQGDCTNGQGTFVLSDGRRYVGEFVNGVRHGQGSFETDDGKIYVGQWQKDVPHGQGRLISPGREDFVGQFVNGRRNGQGEVTYADGTRYNGQWADDLPNGQGIKKMPDGIQYSGEFKNGLMYGRSKMIMPDGNQIKIQWQNDVPAQQEKKQPDSVFSTVVEKGDWSMVSTPGEKQVWQSPESLQTGGHKAVALQELSVAAEGIPPQKEPPIETVEYIAPQTFKKKLLTVEEQTQREAVNEIKVEEAKEVASEAAMPSKGGQASGPQDIHASTPEVSKAEEYASIANVADGANIRSAASLSSEVLRAVPPGYPLVVLERQEDWVQVEDFRKRKGWVHARLLNESRTVIIKVWKGNLRSGPSLTDEIIVKLDYGTVMSVVEKRGDWLKVSDSKKTTGWLYHKVIWP